MRPSRLLHRRAALPAVLAGLMLALPVSAAWAQGLSVPPADLQVTLTDSPDPANEGSEVTYTADVHNAGPGSSDPSVGVTSYLRSDVQVDIVSLSSTKGACYQGSATPHFSCHMSGLAAGETARITAVARPRSPGTVNAEFSAYSEAGDSGGIEDPNRENNGASEPTAVTAHCTISGTPGSDKLVGTPGADVICAGAGHDTIAALAGDDTVRAGPGVDIVRALEGKDHVFGARGNDDLAGGDGRDLVHGGDGRDSITGGRGPDFLVGGLGPDALYGQGGYDYIRARDGVRGNDLADGGPSATDGCLTDRGDRRVGCEGSF